MFKQNNFLSLSVTISRIVFHRPSFHVGTLNAMRFVTAVAEKEKGDILVERVSRELWKRIWSTDKDITQPASLTEVFLYPRLAVFKRRDVGCRTCIVKLLVRIHLHVPSCIIMPYKTIYMKHVVLF